MVQKFQLPLERWEAEARAEAEAAEKRALQARIRQRVKSGQDPRTAEMEEVAELDKKRFLPLMEPEQQHLDLFEDADRWPKHPYCSQDQTASQIRRLKSAILRPYIQANPPHLRVWSLHDIDRAGGGLAWESANLPPPTWAAVNKTNGHAHLSWGLSSPVLVSGLGARDAPMRYLVAIESMMREMLQADPGFAGLITKNPACPIWRTLRGPRDYYELGELAEWLPELEKHVPKRADPRAIERIGLGRNVTLFDHLRLWAYTAVRRYWGGGLQGWNAWVSESNTQALVMNADLFGGNTLEGNEVWHLAKSVAKWVWQHFSPTKFSEFQAAKGRLGGLAKGAANEDKRASARMMRAKGMTQQAIANELGVSQASVSSWLK